MKLKKTDKTQILNKCFDLLEQKYIFPQVSDTIIKTIKEKTDNDFYDAYDDGYVFSKIITEELRTIGKDLHMSLIFFKEEISEQNIPEENNESYDREMNFKNAGFYKMERLQGNISLLDCRSFQFSKEGGALLAAAMTLVKNSFALIIDMRNNHGGAPSMVAEMCSYFLPPSPRILLNTIEENPSCKIQQFWNIAHLCGPRYLDKPLFILTSALTFSAAEDFAYTLQALKRATVVGEITRGGAHPSENFYVHPHFKIRIPTARSINPITQTNWEGTGIQPDVIISQQKALNKAHQLAIDAILAKNNLHSEVKKLLHQDLEQKEL